MDTAPVPAITVSHLTIDLVHSSLEFAVRYLRTTRIRGRLDDFSGQLTGGTDDHDFSNAHLTFQAPVGSLDTNHSQRDQHLRSAEWFAADQFPTMAFESAEFRRTGPHAYDVAGHLVLKGQTHPLTLHARFRGTAHGAQGEGRAGFSFEATLNRRDYGIVAGPHDVGGLFLSDKVKLTGEISLLATAA